MHDCCVRKVDDSHRSQGLSLDFYERKEMDQAHTQHRDGWVGAAAPPPHTHTHTLKLKGPHFKKKVYIIFENTNSIL